MERCGAAGAAMDTATHVRERVRWGQLRGSVLVVVNFVALAPPNALQPTQQKDRRDLCTSAR